MENKQGSLKTNLVHSTYVENKQGSLKIVNIKNFFLDTYKRFSQIFFFISKIVEYSQCTIHVPCAILYRFSLPEILKNWKKSGIYENRFFYGIEGTFDKLRLPSLCRCSCRFQVRCSYVITITLTLTITLYSYVIAMIT